MRILIELPSWLGDTIMATSAIDNIINHFQDSEIVLIGTFISIETLRNHPKISKFKVLQKNYFDLIRISNELGYFESFFSFKGSFRSSVFNLLVSSKNKYKYNKNLYKNLHQVEKYSQFVNDSLRENYLTKKLVLHKSKNNIQNYQKLVVGINPGASYGSAKRWHPEKFSQLAFSLSSKYEIIILGGILEEDIARNIESELIKKGVKNYKNLAGKTSLDELINLISILDLFITGDSGPMHIAASFQIPTVSIFGPTRDDETSQWMNQNSVIVKKNLDCQPCMKRTCPLKHHNCMKLIEPKDILNAVELII
jgi:heptosyltransferase II